MSAWDRALARLEGISAGQNPYDTQIRAAEMERTKGEEQAARGALEQQASQAGMTGQETMTERALLNSQVGAQQNQLMASLRQQESQKAAQAAGQMPGLTQNRREYEVKTATDAASAAIAARDWTGANAALQAAGLPQVDFSTADAMARAGDFERSITMMQPLADLITSMGDNAPDSLVTWYSGMISNLALGGVSSLTLGTGTVGGGGVSPIDQPIPPAAPIASGNYAGYTLASHSDTDHSYTFTNATTGQSVTLGEEEVSRDPLLMAAIPAVDRPGDPNVLWNDPEVRAMANRVSSTVMDWFTNDDPTTGGAQALDMLRGNSYFSGLLDTANNADATDADKAAAWRTIGTVLSYTYKANQSGFDATTTLNNMSRIDPSAPTALVKAGVISAAEYKQWQTVSGAAPTDWYSTLLSNGGKVTALKPADQTALMSAYRSDRSSVISALGGTSPLTASGQNALNYSGGVGTWTTTGDNRWVLKGDVRNWANANLGKAFEVGNTLMTVTQVYNPGGDAGRNSVGYIAVKDMGTGKTWYLFRGGYSDVKPGDDATPKWGGSLFDGIIASQ
jgi:hypothetical protein